MASRPSSIRAAITGKLDADGTLETSGTGDQLPADLTPIRG
jgi:hypothetical protein